MADLLQREKNLNSIAWGGYVFMQNRENILLIFMRKTPKYLIDKIQKCEF